MRTTPETNTRPKRRHAWFFDGGYIIVLTSVVMLALLFWALAPAIFRMSNRGPGDGEDIHSYGFVFSNLRVPEEDILPALNFRGLVNAMDTPAIALGAEVDSINDDERGKMLVSTDRVIGVEVNGEIRAYPLRVLRVHEIINDELGGLPIAVTYSPISDAAAVYSRVVGDEVLEFDVSGLVYNCNLLMNDRRPGMQGESLWSQLMGVAVAGPYAAETTPLQPIPCSVTTWGTWLAAEPNTTVVRGNPKFAGRYKKTNYEHYFRLGVPAFEVSKMPEPNEFIQPMDRVMIVEFGNERRIYPVKTMLALAKTDPRFLYIDTIQEHQLRFTCTEVPETVFIDDILLLKRDRTRQTPVIKYACWFTWHSMFPGDPIWQPLEWPEAPIPMR